jgi:hypothetical protein
MLANTSTNVDIGGFDIDPTLDSNGDYSVESFIDDIANLTAEERAQFSKALGDMSTLLGGLVEAANAQGANISAQTLTDIGNLSKGLGAVATAIDAGLLATKFAAGDFYNRHSGKCAEFSRYRCCRYGFRWSCWFCSFFCHSFVWR